MKPSGIDCRANAHVSICLRYKTRPQGNGDMRSLWITPPDLCGALSLHQQEPWRRPRSTPTLGPALLLTLLPGPRSRAPRGYCPNVHPGTRLWGPIPSSVQFDLPSLVAGGMTGCMAHPSVWIGVKLALDPWGQVEGGRWESKARMDSTEGSGAFVLRAWLFKPRVLLPPWESRRRPGRRGGDPDSRSTTGQHWRGGLSPGQEGRRAA